MKLRILLIVIAILIAAPLCAQDVVWQIGKFDNNYEELAIPHNHMSYSTTFPNDVTFTIGKDDPAKSWPFIQPGPMDGWAGGKSHTFTVVFDMKSEPSGFYHLRIAFVNTHYAYPPTLEIGLNSLSDHIELPAGGPDAAFEDASKGRKGEVNINAPAALLRKGENKITLTTISGSHMMYDALSFTSNAANTTGPAVDNLKVTPTIRFVRRNGQLKRIALMTAQAATTGDEIVVKASFAGKTQTMRLKPRLLGSLSQDIELDDIDRSATVEVTLQSGGASKTASCEVKPVKHWKIFVLPTAHVDIGYTDLQENVKQRHNENTSLAVDLCKKYPDFKWNTEAGWAEDNYLSGAPADKKAEFIRLAQEGRIGCQAIYGNMLTGICSNESLIRDLYYTHSTARDYGIPFDMAVSTDVPTHVWTLPSVLAGSGIKYFAAGLNTVRADSATKLFNKPFYWKGPDGASVLTWLYPGYGAAAGMGLAESVEKAGNQIDQTIKGLSRPDYPYDAFLAYGAFADNQPLNARLASVVHEWNQKYTYPQIILCRGPEFFQYIEKNYKKSIPTYSGDAGVYWEDGAGSSAVETAESRLAKEDLATAEKMFSLASSLGGKSYPDTELSAAWKNAVLYDEHTWGAAGSIDAPESDMTRAQWLYKSRFALNASKAAASLKKRAFDNLAELVRVNEPSVVVFNPLSWPVSDVVRINTADGRNIQFVADVPAMALKTYPLYEAPEPVRFTLLPKVLENSFYRLEFDPVTGGVKSLYDKDLNRELVDSSSYGVNQYVYTSGVGDAFKEFPSGGQTQSVLFSRPPNRAGCQLITITGSAFNTPSWATEVVLYDNQKRIDFLNTLNKSPVNTKEAGYFAFPFKLTKPQFHVALPNGVVCPNKDMLPGGCMAWYCTQDFVTASDDSASITWTALDSPLVTLCDIDHETGDHWNLPKAALKWPSALDNGSIFGYAFNNYWFTNYKASQGGEMTFRFSMTSSKGYDSEAASRFGQSVRNPLIAKIVMPGSSVSGLKSRNTGAGGIALGTSLISISPSNVCIQAIKRAETGGGTIIRLREVGGKASRATIALSKDTFKNAWRCNLVEDRGPELGMRNDRISIQVPANGMSTILVK